ncbi:hypothetical protein F383_20744 [Gossypium arboreum]|uniref:Uncharacterized protein n=1 Tax=Gossypium arboreum TaxID=29729 RepID=A0A0B0NTS5_GOSAR|nr:hypothetical protein F383_20744 [Gossypium arboreum]
MVLAPTVRSHGASFDNVVLEGPEFPAEQLTNIPFFIAANPPMAMLSWKKGTASSPRESESTSTPSSIAASNAASEQVVPSLRPYPWHFPAHQHSCKFTFSFPFFRWRWHSFITE